MGSPIELREDFDGPTLRLLAWKTKHANQRRRPLALAEIYDGKSRSEAARIGGVGLQTAQLLNMRVEPSVGAVRSNAAISARKGKVVMVGSSRRGSIRRDAMKFADADPIVSTPPPVFPFRE